MTQVPHMKSISILLSSYVHGQVPGTVGPAAGHQLQDAAEADGPLEHRGGPDGEEPDAGDQPGAPLGTQHPHR